LSRDDVAQETATNAVAVADTAPRQTAPQGGVAVQPSGVFTTILLRSLEERLSVEQLEDLLRRAGETRSLAEFKETAASTSIEQFTRLRHEANLIIGPRLYRRR
jgi:hypothetical protein